MDRVIIIVVHDAPNTQPGGVHGALCNSAYQVDVTPSFVKKPPKNKPKKLISRKVIKI